MPQKVISYNNVVLYIRVNVVSITSWSVTSDTALESPRLESDLFPSVSMIGIMVTDHFRSSGVCEKKYEMSKSTNSVVFFRLANCK